MFVLSQVLLRPIEHPLSTFILLAGSTEQGSRVLSSSGKVEGSFWQEFMILFCRALTWSMDSSKKDILNSCSALYLSNLCYSNLLDMHFSLFLGSNRTSPFFTFLIS